MLIKNLTSEQQTCTLRELTGERSEFEISIMPNGITDVEKVIVINPDKYAGILAIEGLISDLKVAPTSVVSESKEVEEPKEESKEETKDSSKEEVKEEPKDESKEVKEEVAPDSHKCEICGAEFASARGLATHMNKAHSE